MKRSEMEQKIQSVIESFFHNEDPKYGFLAEYILEEVEQVMVPPFNANAGDGADHQEITGFGYLIDSFCEWEPEDG